MDNKYNLRRKRLKIKETNEYIETGKNSDSNSDLNKTIKSESISSSDSSSDSSFKPDLSSEYDSESNSNISSLLNILRKNRENISEDNDETNESTDYFDLDTNPMIMYIYKQLDEKFDSLNRANLKDNVTNIINSLKKSLVEEYCTAKPTDESWKINVDKKKIEELEPLLVKLRKDIENETPTMFKILCAKIPESDKKRAIQLFDIFKNTEPYTEEYQYYVENINKILTTDINMSNEELLTLQEEEDKITKNLGNNNSNLKIRILRLDVDEKIKTAIYEMYQKLMTMEKDDSNYSSLKQKILLALELPYHKVTKKENINTQKKISSYCIKLRKNLDSKLYGMDKIKERLVEVTNNRLYNPNARSIIALKGIPGVGKTAVASAYADSLGLPFERISLGGMEDPSILKGTDNSWVGANPSILLQILRRMKVSNGVILLDELDKLGESHKGYIVQNALLEILDFIQNDKFRDLFLNEFPHDLSNIVWMVAMNDDNLLTGPLKDRLDILELKPYKSTEITQIIKLHLFPKALKDAGIQNCDITEQACNNLQSLLNINSGGLRVLEKELYQIVAKLNMLRTFLGKKNVKLSYSLPDFKGFPYTVTTSTINNLWTKQNTDTTYLSMYM